MKTTELYLEHEPFIRIFSNSKDGCKIKDLKKTHKFKSDITEFNFGRSFFQKSTFGKKPIFTNLKLLNEEIKYLNILNENKF